jgi:heat shock protein HtpX
MSNRPLVIANVARSCVLLALLFGLVFGLFFAGAMLFEAWRHAAADLATLAERALVHVDRLAPYLLLGCVAWIVVALVLGGYMIRASSSCRLVKPGTQPRIERILQQLCLKADMQVPQLGIIDSNEMNAFASGLFADDYTVAVSRGLMARLTDAELEAVMAHELTHIKNRDVMLCVIAATVTGGFALLAEALMFGITRALRLVFGSGDDSEAGAIAGWVALVIGFVLVILATFISTLIGFALSRSREYLADAGAAAMTGRPEALISALEKLTDDCDIEAPAGVMQMCIARPRPFLDLFSTHPRTEDRIAALKAIQKTATRRQPRRPMVGLEIGQARASFGQR